MELTRLARDRTLELGVCAADARTILEILQPEEDVRRLLITLLINHATKAPKVVKMQLSPAEALKSRSPAWIPERGEGGGMLFWDADARLSAFFSSPPTR